MRHRSQSVVDLIGEVPIVLRKRATSIGTVGLLATVWLALPVGGQTAAPREDAKAQSKPKIGQRKGESDEKYSKRRELIVRRAKKDDDGLFTAQVQPFIVRTDISPEFTADTALYMEMLHREFGLAYQKMGLPPGPPKEWIEVIIYADRETYLKTGGGAGSGGYFAQAFPFFQDRPQSWKAQHYRLAMFTDGEKEFARYDKSTLKHEAAHMELQMRLGYLVDCPRWWNEGQAACFEFWDFDKSVDENLKLIPTRGRYAPVVRRLWDTDKFRPFSYVWDIDAASWHADMTSEQGALNYCQAWSLAAFMLNEGRAGRKAFNTIFELSKRVGADRKVSGAGKKTLAWQSKFPKPAQEEMEAQWMEWIRTHLPKDGRNADEREGLINLGYDPDAEGLVRLTKERYAEVKKPKDDSAKVSGKGSERRKKSGKPKSTEPDDGSAGGPQDF